MKPLEDWVDGSWTVDCVCGVNFDDGKEMVNCDECGVWVHTRCSRYVKGNDLFACHKCKIKHSDSAAMLLKMENLSARNQTVHMNRGFRACTEIPIEERVHVQGVPGGDLAVFERFSSVFSRQLWKSSGYVPKKFRFQYSEFPCWDDQKENASEIDVQEDACAEVLLSMSKENDVADVVVEKLGAKDSRRSLVSRGIEINREKRLLCSLSAHKGRKDDSEDRLKKK
ncbi:hypothetical protein EUTSA_v10029370mg, partial [Eutrema salsugineum]